VFWALRWGDYRADHLAAVEQKRKPERTQGKNINDTNSCLGLQKLEHKLNRLFSMTFDKNADDAVVITEKYI